MKIVVTPVAPAYVPPLSDLQVSVIKRYFETDPDANWNFVCDLLDAKHDDAIVALWEASQMNRTW